MQLSDEDDVIINADDDDNDHRHGRNGNNNHKNGHQQPQQQQLRRQQRPMSEARGSTTSLARTSLSKPAHTDHHSQPPTPKITVKKNTKKSTKSGVQVAFSGLTSAEAKTTPSSGEVTGSMGGNLPSTTKVVKRKKDGK